MATAILTIEIEFDEKVTDADAVGVAVDSLLETALSTPGILDEYGNPSIGQTYIQHPRVPLLMKYVAVGEDDEMGKLEFLQTVAERLKDDIRVAKADELRRPGETDEEYVKRFR